MKPTHKKDNSRKPTFDQLAERYGVSKTTISKWRQLRVDIYDLSAVSRHVATLQKKPPGWKGGIAPENQPVDFENLDAIENLENARLAKTILEAKRIAFALEVERGRFVDSESVRENGVKIGAAVKAAVLRLESELPPILEGLDAPEIQKQIRTAGDEILRMLADTESDLWNSV